MISSMHIFSPDGAPVVLASTRPTGGRLPRHGEIRQPAARTGLRDRRDRRRRQRNVEAAQRLQPDVIVLDVNLPNVQSLEACREIRRVNPATKVIMFTAMADPATSQAFLGAGHTAFVSKLASEDLLSTIKRLCIDEG